MSLAASDFVVEVEIDAESLSVDRLKEELASALKKVACSHYVNVRVTDYKLIAEIARFVSLRKAAVDTVLRKGASEWIVMIKNEVPVAQLDRA